MKRKTCSACGRTLSAENYNESRQGVLRANCKSCQNAYNADYRRRNPERSAIWAANRKARSREYRADNKARRLAYLKQWARANPEKRRAQKYRHRYGIDVEQYEELFAKQNGRCAICHSRDYGRAGAKCFVVDHCHASGRVRGLLCHRCNMLLSFADDDAERLKAAGDYLGRRDMPHIEISEP